MQGSPLPPPESVQVGTVAGSAIAALANTTSLLQVASNFADWACALEAISAVARSAAVENYANFIIIDTPTLLLVALSRIEMNINRLTEK